MQCRHTVSFVHISPVLLSDVGVTSCNLTWPCESGVFMLNYDLLCPLKNGQFVNVVKKMLCLSFEVSPDEAMQIIKSGWLYKLSRFLSVAHFYNQIDQS